ncbi:hypothetical protein AX14_011491 [Amanita brunnescens Koide BX004]|nr:hypothetical protein AX14_011491 [Amanita brunnescens Koide BX004]
MYILSHLPSSLIVSSFLFLCSNLQSGARGAELVARAAPIETPEIKILELNPDTFKQTIADGFWFIEHFSPFCHHCRKFASIWKTLTHDALTEIPHVKLATVNCAVHGDLCDENGVTGYPDMKLFSSGAVLETFNGDRELSIIKDFLHKHAPTPSPPPPSTPSSKTDAKTDIQLEPEPEPHFPILNPSGKVLSLDPTTFHSTLAQGPMFVKFFAPWCGHCKRLAPTWAQVAKALQNGHVTIAEVNCDDHSELCKKYNIEGYPTLSYIGKEGMTEYKGGRKFDQLVSFVEKASAPSLRRLKSAEDLKTQVSERDVMYLLLFTTHPTQDVLNAFKDAASSLLGQPSVFYSSDAELIQQYGVSRSPWALIALKDHDTETASSIFLPTHISPDIGTDDISLLRHIRAPHNELSTWLRTHRLPTSLQLSQDTFQDVMAAPEEPLIIIAAAPQNLDDKVQKKLGDLVAMWRSRTSGTGRATSSASGARLGKGLRVKKELKEREVVLTWMDAEKWKDWIKSMYEIQYVEGMTALGDVEVVIVDHKRLIYWNRDSQGNSLRLSKRLLDVVQDVVDGKLDYKHSETTVERLARTLSDGLLNTHHYVSEHALMSLIFVAGGCVVVFWVVKRFITTETYEHRRLD